MWGRRDFAVEFDTDSITVFHTKSLFSIFMYTDVISFKSVQALLDPVLGFTILCELSICSPLNS